MEIRIQVKEKEILELWRKPTLKWHVRKRQKTAKVTEMRQAKEEKNQEKVVL